MGIYRERERGREKGWMGVRERERKESGRGKERGRERVGERGGEREKRVRAGERERVCGIECGRYRETDRE